MTKLRIFLKERTKRFFKEEFNSEAVREALKTAIKDYPVFVITQDNHFAAFQPVVKNDSEEAISLHPEAAQKLGIKFGEKLILHLPLSEAAISELKNPRPQGEAKSEILDFNPEKLVECTLSGKEISLTDFDKVILGID